MANNIVSFGLKNVVYSEIFINNGEITYGPPIRLKGAQELTADINGSNTPVYGDDYMLHNFNAYVGHTIQLKMTELDWDFKFRILGYLAEPHNNWFEVANAEVRPFALGYEIDGDEKKRRIWYLFCTAKPTSLGTKSKTDSVEANSITLEITSYAIKDKKDREIIKMIANEGDLNYDTFLTTRPSLNFVTTVTYRYCPTDNINTNDFFEITGSPSDVSNHTYDGKSYTKGLKFNSSALLRFQTPNYTRATMTLVGYANQSAEMPSPTLNVGFSTQARSFQISGWSLKDVVEMSRRTFNNLYKNSTVRLSKGTEIMLCDLIVTFTIEE